MISFVDPYRLLLRALNPLWDDWHLTAGKDTAVSDGHTPREKLRIAGDHINALCPGALVRAAATRTVEAMDRGSSVVIDDVRYEAEAEMVRDLAGIVVHAQRPELAFSNDHPTERGVSHAPDDLVLANPGGIRELRAELAYVLSRRAGRWSS